MCLCDAPVQEQLNPPGHRGCLLTEPICRVCQAYTMLIRNSFTFGQNIFQCLVFKLRISVLLWVETWPRPLMLERMPQCSKRSARKGREKKSRRQAAAYNCQTLIRPWWAAQLIPDAKSFSLDLKWWYSAPLRCGTLKWHVKPPKTPTYVLENVWKLYIQYMILDPAIVNYLFPHPRIHVYRYMHWFAPGDMSGSWCMWWGQPSENDLF